MNEPIDETTFYLFPHGVLYWRNKWTRLCFQVFVLVFLYVFLNTNHTFPMSTISTILIAIVRSCVMLYIAIVILIANDLPVHTTHTCTFKLYSTCYTWMLISLFSFSQVSSPTFILLPPADVSTLDPFHLSPFKSLTLGEVGLSGTTGLWMFLSVLCLRMGWSL